MGEGIVKRKGKSGLAPPGVTLGQHPTRAADSRGIFSVACSDLRNWRSTNL
jgi:hypothetical protein